MMLLDSHVRIFLRKPFRECFSLEGYFENIEDSLASRCTVDSVVMPWHSKGIVPRYKCIQFAKSNQADINHIAGDIHFIAMGMDPSRTVLTVLDCEMLHRTSGVRRSILKHFWFTKPCKTTAAITVISEATKDELLRHIDYPSDRIHVIPVFIDERHTHAPREFDSECPKILQIGTRHNKNIERLVMALQGIQCQLWLVGNLSDEHKELLSKHGVDYRSFQELEFDELRKLYVESDIVTFASLHEGFGMPILEAQVTGRPVITSNLSSMPEVAGDGALFVDPFSVESIRDAVITCIDEPEERERVVGLGRSNCIRYSRDAIVDQYVELYRSLR